MICSEKKSCATQKNRFHTENAMHAPHNSEPVRGISILVVVYIAGCSLQCVEATEPPNVSSVPILLHLL